MKKINWRLGLLFLVVAFGLYTITESFLMSLGIFMLLLVGDYFAQQYDAKRRYEKEMKHNDAETEDDNK